MSVSNRDGCFISDTEQPQKNKQECWGCPNDSVEPTEKDKTRSECLHCAAPWLYMCTARVRSVHWLHRSSYMLTPQECRKWALLWEQHDTLLCVVRAEVMLS